MSKNLMVKNANIKSDLKFLQNLNGGQWVIDANALGVIEQRAQMLIDGKEIAAIGQIEDNPSLLESKNVDGIEIINISGTLVKDADIFEQYYFGLVSMRTVESKIMGAIKSESVKAILLNIDSPGGTVDGTERLGQVILENSKIKKIGVFSDSMVCSGAYWISSGASFIMAQQTSTIGSIGVILSQMEFSRALEKNGITANIIRSAKNKAIGGPFEPLTPERRQVLQEDVNKTAELFKTTIQAARGEKIDMESIEDGGTVDGAKAVEVGLIDAVGYFEDALKLIKKGIKMNIEELKANHADLVEQIQSEAKAEAVAEIAETHISLEAHNEALKAQSEKNADAIEAGIQAEKDRVAAIKESAMDCQSILCDELVESGVSVEEAKEKLHADLKEKAENGELTKENTEDPKKAVKSAAKDILDNNAPPAASQPENDGELDLSKLSGAERSKKILENREKIKEKAIAGK